MYEVHFRGESIIVSIAIQHDFVVSPEYITAVASLGVLPHKKSCIHYTFVNNSIWYIIPVNAIYTPHHLRACTKHIQLPLV